MSDPSRELAELAADLRAHAEHLRSRGVRADVPGPMPAGTGQLAPGEPAAAWSELAASARAEGEVQAERGAVGLRRVREELGDCRRCGLCKGRTTLVFGVGDPEADLVVVGEAPGYNEDRQGEPFVGEAGAMLDKMLANVLGLPRERVYICNVVKCRPPENRNPLPDEVDACLPFLRRQIAAVAPKVLLVLGAVAYKSLFGTDTGITRARGVWHDYDGVPAMPTFHPAYLLRRPDDKKHTFDDLKRVRALYDERGGRR